MTGHGDATYDPPAGTDPAVARADFLRLLPAADFRPPEWWVEKLNATAGTAIPVTDDVRDHHRRRFDEQVDELAGQFWELSAAERRQRWQALTDQGGDGPAANHLKHLERGLDVLILVQEDDPAVEELAGISRELFVLRPRARAVRRSRWLEHRDRDINWTDACRRLWAFDETAAQLDPTLVNGFTEAKLPTRAVRAVVPPPPSYEEAEPRTRRRRAYRDEPEPERRSGGMPWRYGGVGVLAVILLAARLLFGVAGGCGRSTYSPQPTRFDPAVLERIKNPPTAKLTPPPTTRRGP